jgi:hypothetical protein
MEGRIRVFGTVDRGGKMAITLGNVFLLDTGIAGFIALLITLTIIDLVFRDPAAKPPEEMANALGISLFFWGGTKVEK